MTSPGLLFMVAKLEGDNSSCRCGVPAEFQIVGWTTTLGDKYCGQCMAAHLLQTLKNEGVDVERVCEMFPGASKALDKAPVSSEVQ